MGNSSYAFVLRHLGHNYHEEGKEVRKGRASKPLEGKCTAKKKEVGQGEGWCKLQGREARGDLRLCEVRASSQNTQFSL